MFEIFEMNTCFRKKYQVNTTKLSLAKVMCRLSIIHILLEKTPCGDDHFQFGLTEIYRKKNISEYYKLILQIFHGNYMDSVDGLKRISVTSEWGK